MKKLETLKAEEVYDKHKLCSMRSVHDNAGSELLLYKSRSFVITDMAWCKIIQHEIMSRHMAGYNGLQLWQLGHSMTVYTDLDYTKHPSRRSKF